MKYLIEKYNREDSLIIISSYPEKDVLYSKKVCAVGGFTKNVINQLPGHKIILTTTLGNKSDQVYEEKKNLIYRIFKRNHLISFIKLFFALGPFTNVKKILVQFEFSSFGDIKNTAIFPLLLLAIRLTGREIYFVFHQVIINLSDIAEYLGWRENDRRIRFYNLFLKLFYRIVIYLSKKTIVLEEEFKHRLLKIVNSSKIHVIAHGVDANLASIDKRLAKKKLGIQTNKPIILYFGYLTWYKGADLIRNIAIRNKKFYFIIAGGPSFTQKKKNHYVKYLKKFINLPTNVRLTGFVEEKKIPIYFSASDLVILPYRTMISSSGPLSLAFSFEKPVVLSNKLKAYIKSKDFRSNFIKSGLYTSQLFKDLNKNKKLDLNSKLKSKLIRFSKLMKNSRQYKVISNEYSNILKNGV